jgi:hypothetical protein
MDPNAKVFVPDRVKAVIRHVMNPTSPKFKISDLVWTIPKSNITVYRGQCAQSPKNIPRVGSNPFEISNYGKPISTSRKITDKIRAFSCKPNGRLFKIDVVPGVRIADLQVSLRGYNVNTDAAFEFFRDELPPSSVWKKKSLGELRAAFFSTLGNEKEILLDLSTGQFLNEDWKSPEVNGVYMTKLYPLPKSGRRRTLRSRRKKRTYRRRV